MAFKVIHKFVHICVTFSTTVKIVVFAFFVARILCTLTVAGAVVITTCLAWQFNKMYHYQQVIIVTVSSCLLMWWWHDCVTNYYACSIWATPHLSPLYWLGCPIYPGRVDKLCWQYSINVNSVVFYQCPQHQHPQILFQSFLMETVDSSGTLISSQEYGITIIIPPGAIPEGTEIQLQVHCCSSGPFVLPKGYRLCSPVYIISPSYHFLKDIIEVWIVHHAYLSDSEDCSQMIFLTDAPTPEEFDYRKPKYHIQGGRFSIHSVLGKISLKHFYKSPLEHFCKKAIAAKISIDGEATPEKKIEGMVHTFQWCSG